MARRRNGRDDREGRDAGEALKALEAIRRALTAEEAAQLDVAFPALLAAQFGFVGEQLRRRGLAEHEAEDLVQETFLALREHLRANGFPDDMAALLRVIVKRRFLNHLRAKLRSPISVGLPSSRSEKPTSTPDPERVLTHRQIGEQAFAELSPEHQEVFWAVLISGLTHAEAADLLELPEGTVKSRVAAAKREFAARCRALVPPSSAGGKP